MASLAKRFMSRFAGLERAHGTYELGAGVRADSKNKVKGQALTKLEPVTEELWLAHLNGDRGLGVVPIRDDNTCQFAAIDIDFYDGLDLAKLEATIAGLGLPLVVCRSKSGGAHCYLFLVEPVAARVVRLAMTEWAAALGFPKAEVFPKQDQLASSADVGNWINMPYFNAERTTRYATQGGKAQTAEQFLKLAATRAVTLEQLSAVAVVPALGIDQGPPCLQYLARQGFGEGARNNALFNLGVYCRLRYNAEPQWLPGGEDWQSAVVKMNEQFMSPSLDKREVKEVLNSLRRRNYFFLCNQPPINNHCNKELCRQRRYGIGNGHGDVEAEAAVQVENPRRILTEPVTWVITIKGKDLELTTEELMDQLKFRRKAVEKLKTVLPPIGRKAWQKMMEAIVNEAQDVEAPDDAGPEGRMYLLLEDFCTNHAEAQAEDEILLGRPFTKEGRTIFRGKDFMRYLDQHHFRSMNERQVWAVLRRRGAAHTKVGIKGKTFTCWTVDAFDRQQEDFKPVKATEEDF